MMGRSKRKSRKKRDSLRYLVLTRGTATGYSVDVPDVPGCVATAKTVKGARRLIAEALTLHLELMQQAGEAVPVPRRSIEFAVDESSDEEFCTWVEVAAPQAVSAAPGPGGTRT